MKLAWKAYVAELAATQMAEHPSGAGVAERLREYLCNRLTEATQSSVLKLLSGSAGLDEIISLRLDQRI